MSSRIVILAVATLIRVFPYFASYNAGADENLIQGFRRHLKSSVSR